MISLSRFGVWNEEAFREGVSQLIWGATMKVHLFLSTSLALATFTGLFTTGCRTHSDVPPLDLAEGRKPEDFPELALDVFQPMDGGIKLDANEIKGRNSWNLW